MSYPNIPNVNPNITITRDEVINLLLASIALEEMGLAHLINTEAEKIQYVLNTLEGIENNQTITINELLQINDSVEKMLRDVIKSEMLLGFKLTDIIQIPPESISIFRNIATVIGDYDGNQYTDNDLAYYHKLNKQEEVMI